MKKFALAVALATVGFTYSVSAITWFPKKFVCPIDQQENTFMVVGSYGSYIYNYPSKYQWLFFPTTSSNTFYMCKKCHLTTYMWDYKDFPKSKVESMKKKLKSLGINYKFAKYTEVDLTDRLEVMEEVYKDLDKDELWWERFYRIKGYHYGAAGDTSKAAAERRRSLAIIEKEIAKDGKSKVPLKILYYMSGAMRHFLGEDDAARENLSKAKATKYADPSAKPDQIKNAEAGLNSRLDDYLSKIGTEKAPRNREIED